MVRRMWSEWRAQMRRRDDAGEGSQGISMGQTKWLLGDGVWDIPSQPGGRGEAWE